MTPRVIFGYLLLALASHAGAQNVTYTNPGAAIGVCLEEIDKATGLQLHAATSIAGEPVAIAVKDVPLPVLQDKLATVLGGQWEARPDGSIWFSRPSGIDRGPPAGSVR